MDKKPAPDLDEIKRLITPVISKHMTPIHMYLTVNPVFAIEFTMSIRNMGREIVKTIEKEFIVERRKKRDDNLY